MSDKHIDELSGVATTGHEWDGIRELDNPMPRWWLWAYYASIVFAVGYMIAYPAWPLIRGNTPGVLGYSTRGELQQKLDAAEALKSDYLAGVANASVDEIMADDNLRTFATAAGSAAFKVNCVQCHGTGAMGGGGYPNLNDDNWLWGGSAEEIRQTIAHGIRYDGDDDTRFSEMPAFGDILEPEEITQVVAYVTSLTGHEGDAKPADIEAGETVFVDNCSSCHAEDATGDREFGAPNLRDAIWLYGSTPDDIRTQVLHPRHGVMPAWQARLGETTVKELAVYVHSLGGGE